jgi:Ca-activated chloride channel family protein
VTGRVTDSLTNGVVTSGQVTVAGTTISTTIQDNGTFTISVPAGDVVLSVRSIGFKRKDVPVPARQNQVNVILGRDYFQLEAIVVTGQARGRGRLDNTIAPVQPIQLPAFQAARKGRHEPDQISNTEDYDDIVESRFLSPDARPLSTFAIDVDPAAYGNVRRYISSGTRPPADAVRIEELVNYFPYAYPEPTGDQPFSISTELVAAPWAPEHELLRIGLRGRSVKFETMPPNNLVFLVDLSGSMNAPEKLPLLKSALRMMVNVLRDQDQVAIVGISGTPELILPSTAAIHKTRIQEAIAAMEADGSSPGAEGLKLAYQTAKNHLIEGGNNRVIFATDGDVTAGVSSDVGLIHLIEEERGQGIFLTVLGFGKGNLKDSRLEKLADHGNGNYAYVDKLLEARRVLVKEIGGTVMTIAKDVKIQLEFNPARVQGYRLIGYEDRMMRAEDFANDQKDGGELGAGHTVTALYEIIPAEATAEIPLRYQRVLVERTPATSSNELGYLKLRYKEPGGKTSRLVEQPIVAKVTKPTDDMVFASAVASFGLQLRESEFRGTWTMDDVFAAVDRTIGKDEGGYRTEFLEMVDRVMRARMVASVR